MNLLAGSAASRDGRRGAVLFASRLDAGSPDPMALARYVVQDEGGERIGPFVSTRSEWRKGDRLVIGGSLYRVIAVVSFDRPDEAGAIAALTVAQTI